MIVLRNKNYSSADYASGVYDVADRLENYVDYAENSHPIVNKASKRWRDRIKGYTKPIKKLISNKKKQ